MNNSSFNKYQLDNNLIAIINQLGYHKMTPIQEAVIPKVLRGENIIARAETGSGKSHAYLIPLIVKAINLQGLSSIIIAPSRELAQQIYHFADAIVKQLPDIKVRLITGGRQRKLDEQKLKNVPHMLIITPGRLVELLKTSTHRLLIESSTIVLDEVDMLINDGFFSLLEPFLQIWKGNQLLTFSASMPKNLTPLVKKYAPSISTIDINEKQFTSNLVNHHLIDIHHQDILSMVIKYISNKRPYLLLIFASKIETVEDIYNHLIKNNFKAAMIHGKMIMRQRMAMMKRIKANEFQIIVASDLAARGIDISDISDVLSVDWPSRAEYYMHRAGRTGRNQRTGDSYLFINKEDSYIIDFFLAKTIPFDLLSLKEDELKKINRSSFYLQQTVINSSSNKEIDKTKKQRKKVNVKPRYKVKIAMARQKRQRIAKRNFNQSQKRKEKKK
jgi:ATP-dependent RNA helicase CshB